MRGIYSKKYFDLYINNCGRREIICVNLVKEQLAILTIFLHMEHVDVTARVCIIIGVKDSKIICK